MRSRVIQRIVEALRGSPSSTPSTSAKATPTRRPSSKAATELSGGFTVEYSPCLDGDPDPGEVVWAWVPYEDDPSQGKDRPLVIIGRRGTRLVGVPLTSKPHSNEPQVGVGSGSWDRSGRPSYAKVERVIDIDPDGVRREGAVLPRALFDDIVEAVRRHHHA
jgi:hypothetical protein